MPFTFTNFQPLSSEQVNPYNAALTQAFQTYGKGIQSAYTPQMLQADIFHKTLSPLATIASNPLLWSIMSRDQQQNIANLISRTLSNAPGGQLTPVNQAITNQLQGTQPISNYGNTQNIPSKTSIEYGDENKAFPEEVEFIAQHGNNAINQQGNLPPTQFNRNAPAFNLPGTTGAVNPLGISKAQQAGLETSATSEASTQNEIFKNMTINATNLGKSAQMQDLLMTEFDNAYSHLEPSEHGAGLGNIIALTPSAQTADRAAKNLGAMVASDYQTGHITDSQFQAFQNMKIGRYMTPEAKEEASQYIHGLSQRNLQYLPFVLAAQKRNYTPQEIDAIWQYYTTQVPFYNVKTGKMNSEIYSWEDYLEPKKAFEALSPKARNKVSKEYGTSRRNISKEIEQGQGQQKVDDIKRIGNKEYHKIAGQWLPVLGGQ